MRFLAGNRYFEHSTILHLVVFLIHSCVTEMTTTPLIQVDNPGNLTLGGLFLLTSLDEKETCRDTLSPDGMRSFLAMLFAVETINADDSILPNITLGTNVFDTCTSRVSALDYTLKHFVFSDNNEKLSQYPIVGLVGPFASIEAITISKVLGVFKIPVISYSATSHELSDKLEYKYFSRTIPSDLSQVKAIIEVLKYFNWTYVSVVYTEESYGRSGFELLKIEAAKHEMCFANEIKLPSLYDEATYREKLGQLALLNKSDVILLFCFGETITSVVQTMASAITHFDKLQLISAESIGQSWILDQVLPLKTGLIYARAMAQRVEAYDKYIANLSVQKMNRSWWFKRFYEEIMDCTFENTSKIAQRCNSSEKIGNVFLGDNLYQIADKVIDAVYVFAHSLHRVLETTCSSNLSNLFDGCKISGDELLNVIRNSSFTSADGRTVHMDSKGEVNGGYTFHYVTSGNKKGTFKYTNIGQWHGEYRLKMNSTFISSSNLFSVKARCSEPCSSDRIQQHIRGKPVCCWTCVECPPGSIVKNKTSCHACDRGFFADAKRGRCVKIQETYYSLDRRVSKFLVVPPLVFSSLGILGVIFTMCILIKFNNNPLVKASARELCYILLTGLFLSFLFPIFCILRPSRLSCLLQFLLDSLPITISFVSIAVKTNRVFRVFDQSRKLTIRPLFMRPLHQIIFSLLLIFIQILMLLSLVIMQYPKENLVYFSSTEVHLVCSTSESQIVLSHLYNLLLIFICTYYAFKTRHVPSRYKETKIIAFAMYASSMMIVTFMIVFVVAASRGADGIFQLAIHSYRVVLMATVILLSFFGPKVYYIVFQHDSMESGRFLSNPNGESGSILRRNRGHSRTSQSREKQKEDGSKTENEMKIHRNRQDCKRWTF